MISNKKDKEKRMKSAETSDKESKSKDIKNATADEFNQLVKEIKSINFGEKIKKVVKQNGDSCSYDDIEEAIHDVGSMIAEKVRKEWKINPNVLKLSKLSLQLQDNAVKCESYDKLEFKKFVADKKDKTIFLHVNANGTNLNPKKTLKKISNLLETCDFSPDIVCLSEANLLENDKASLDGYKEPHITPAEGRCGGVAIFVKIGLTSEERSDLKFKPRFSHCEFCTQSPNGAFENVWIKCKRPEEDKYVVIGVIYRHPKNNVELFKSFISKLAEKLDKITSESSTLYLLGDFNLNLLENNTENVNSIKSFCKLLHKYNCKVLITKPTRFSNTLIDHIYTNDVISNIACSGVIKLTKEGDGLDHHAIFCIL